MSEERQQPAEKTGSGTIKLTAKGVGFIDRDNAPSIEIHPEALNTAFHLDTVNYRLTGAGFGGRLRGEVLKIVSRAKNNFVGTVIDDKGKPMMIADDRRVYTPFALSAKEADLNQLVDKKVVVKIINWSDPRRPPLAQIVKIIGAAGAHETEMQAIVYDKGLDINLPDAVEKEARVIEARAAEEIATEALRRRDFRPILTFTIDPHDAKDFDDALSYQVLTNGQIEVGIHIADVTHYVRSGSALEKEASGRTTSIYLVDRTIPMLPEVLSNNLCSLMPDVDRLTFSAVFTFTKDGHLTSEWFGKTIIHSDRRFAYEEVAALLDQTENEVSPADKPCYFALRELNRLAKKLQRQKLDAGALVFDDDEVKFILDADGKPVEAFRKIRNDAHRLIEDFMLLANKKVAEYAAKVTKNLTGQFVYRIHDYPKEDKIKNLGSFLALLGHKLPQRKGKVYSSDINKLLEAVEGTPEAAMINRAVVQTMAKAIYSLTNIGHYGLAFPHYTHFTSPIRRYPDMMVHRLLDLYLRGRRPSYEELQEYDRLVRHASDMERAAQEAERESVKYKQVEYMSSRLGQEFTGVISGVTEWGLYVEELTTKAEGLVHVRTLNDYYVFDEKNYCLVGQKTKKKYRLGDVVAVKVVNTDLKNKQLDYELISR